MKQILLFDQRVPSSLNIVRVDVERHKDVHLLQTVPQFVNEKMNFSQSFQIDVVFFRPTVFRLGRSEQLVALKVTPRLETAQRTIVKTQFVSMSNFVDVQERLKVAKCSRRVFEFTPEREIRLVDRSKKKERENRELVARQAILIVDSEQTLG